MSTFCHPEPCSYGTPANAAVYGYNTTCIKPYRYLLYVYTVTGHLYRIIQSTLYYKVGIVYGLTIPFTASACRSDLPKIEVAAAVIVPMQVWMLSNPRSQVNVGNDVVFASNRLSLALSWGPSPK
jgi:hypothetical protein